MNTIAKIFTGWIIFIVIIMAAYFGYKRYITAKGNECSSLLYVEKPLLFQQYYCFEETVADVQTKLNDTNSKIAMLEQKQKSAGVSTAISADMLNNINNGLICLRNYKAYLEHMMDKYINVSLPRLKELVSAECGGFYPVDKSIVTYPINCKAVVAPWITSDDLRPDVACPLFTS